MTKLYKTLLLTFLMALSAAFGADAANAQSQFTLTGSNTSNSGKMTVGSQDPGTGDFGGTIEFGGTTQTNIVISGSTNANGCFDVRSGTIDQPGGLIGEICLQGSVLVYKRLTVVQDDGEPELYVISF